MIVIDTNILISALIKDSITRKIIIESSLNFAYPEISLYEIIKHKDYILKKGNYNRSEFNTILNRLLEYINLIPLNVTKLKLDEAKEVMKDIDINDTAFLATALALDKSTIWSDDTDFEKQKIVKILKTKDMARIFEKWKL